MRSKAMAFFGAFAVLAFGLVNASEKSPATAAAEAWLATVDSGRYGESWDAAAEFFQRSVARSQWESAVAAVREPLGAVASRTLVAAQPAESLPGAPRGKYVVLQFKTDFANKAGALETVTPALGADGTWRVSGYFVK
jgi:hypothetical protein